MGGAAVLCLFIILAWFALREEPSPLDQQPAKTETVKSPAHVAPLLEPLDEVPNETPTNHPDDSASTNAAVIYRQAFDLFNAMSREQIYNVSDWRTNLNASVEAELCEKIRPICNLMQKALTVTNCDWGIDLRTFGPKLSDLNGVRNIVRAAIWSAAHCRSNDVIGATEDMVSALQVGQQISRSAVIGCLVDIAVQSITASYVTQNLGLFHDANGTRLAAAFDNPVYQESPSRAMEQDADSLDRLVAKLSSLPAGEAEKQLTALYGLSDTDISEISRDLFLADMKQVADLDRELAKALSSSSENELEAWQTHSTELAASNPFAKINEAYEAFVDRAQRAAVSRAMVVAGLAVAQNGTDALASHPDPSSGQPFVYTETPDGFELQSSYQVNGNPMKMQFK